MKTVILCGGQGTRLREETEIRPKPMVHIGARPILWHIMKTYAHYGHRDFVICLGYKGEMIKDYFCHYEIMNNDVTLELGKADHYTIHHCHEEKGWRITLADTGKNTLKGARLKKVQKYVKEKEFMLTYGDGVADIDLEALVAFHRRHGKIATVTGINIASRFGELKVKGSLVQAFSEKKTSHSGLINGGFFVFNRGIFDYLTEDDDCDLEIGALERVTRDRQLMVYKHRGSWACMDTLRDMDYLNRLWSDNQAFWKVWK